MLIWVLIAAAWVAVLLLILHDAIKIEGSSPVSAGLHYVVLLVLRGLKTLFAQRHRVARIRRSRKKVSVAPSASNDPTETLPSLPLPEPSVLTATEQQPFEASKNKWWSKDRRAPITSAELELAIADAVRKASPECEDFVGVIVHQRNPKIRLDPNWDVRGTKFGKADRKRAQVALAAVVDKLQQQFRLADLQS